MVQDCWLQCWGDIILKQVWSLVTTSDKKNFISWLTITPLDSQLPFKLTQRQFPTTCCFAITINKSQDQSLSNVWIYHSIIVFSQYRQLYVTISKVRSEQGFKILTLDKRRKILKYHIQCCGQRSIWKYSLKFFWHLSKINNNCLHVFCTFILNSFVIQILLSFNFYMFTQNITRALHGSSSSF